MSALEFKHTHSTETHVGARTANMLVHGRADSKASANDSFLDISTTRGQVMHRV
jgi:hypothetical protein